MDLLYWQGTSCAPAENVQWMRPTSVLCEQKDDVLREDALVSLIAKANLSGGVGSIAMAFSSPTTGRIEQLMRSKVTRERVSFLVLVDTCCTDAGVIEYAVRAMNRQAMMVIVSRDQCMAPVWKEANRRVFRVHRVPPVPGDIVQPTSAQQRGNLLWLTYPKGISSDEIAHAVLTVYAAPWMADGLAPRGQIPAATNNWLAGAAGLGLGAMLASALMKGWKNVKRRA